MPGHALDPLLFYKLRAAQLAVEVGDLQYQIVRAARLETLQNLLREAGVDPLAPYALVDDGHQLVPIQGGRAHGRSDHQ